MRLLNKISFAFLIFCFAFATQGFAQKEKEKEKEKIKKVNFGYSTNPPAKKAKKKNAKTVEKAGDSKKANSSSGIEKKSAGKDVAKKVEKPDNITVEATTPKSNEVKVENISIANKTREVAKKASKAKLLPTEYYKVGVGDVLYINLQNNTAKYYTVLVDGTIDYPLAGKLVSVVDLTTDEIEDLLREKIKLYENPQVTVKVREYVSHKFKVLGLARVGEHFLQREAMPLVVVKTMIGVKPEAKKVIVERENEEPKTILINDKTVNNFLVKSGDVLTFTKGGLSQNKVSDVKILYYFLGNKICDGGKKKFHSGITLVQAVFDACGGLNTKLKDVSITRKNKSGKFVSIVYNFKDILKGKQEDPTLHANDLIDSEK